MLKILKSSLVLGLLLVGCNSTEENTTTIKVDSTKKIKEKNVLMTTGILDSNNENLQKELKDFYERFFSDKLEKALASSQNLHNPTFTPLIEAFPFAIRSTKSYKKVEQRFKENGYKIEGEIDFEKFHTSSTEEGYTFHFSSIFLKPIRLKDGEDIPKYWGCEEVIDIKFGNYFLKRKLFVRDNRCITSTESILINRETKQSIDLEGFATGIQRFTIHDKKILKINMHMGTHVNALHFFFIETEDLIFESKLVPIKNGFMASDNGDPSVAINSWNNSIDIQTYHSKEKFVDDKPCRYLVEDSFSYDYKKKEFVQTKSEVEKLSECADE